MKLLISNIQKILFLIISLFLLSCSNDDNDMDFEYSVIGKWEVTNAEANSSFDDDILNIKVGDIITINQDGTYETPVETGKWEQDGNRLTFYVENSVPAVTEIVKLTDKELEIFLNYGSLVEYDLKLKRIE